jgi:hypothetical protein
MRLESSDITEDNNRQREAEDNDQARKTGR